MKIKKNELNNLGSIIESTTIYQFNDYGTKTERIVHKFSRSVQEYIKSMKNVETILNKYMSFPGLSKHYTSNLQMEITRLQ